MLKSKSRRVSRTVQSEYARLDVQLKSHPAWRGEISLTETTERLSTQSPFTYIISMGLDKYHYFLSYVSAEGVVKHKNLRILCHEGKVMYKNGGGNGGPSTNISELIPQCLKCSEMVCKPL